MKSFASIREKWLLLIGILALLALAYGGIRLHTRDVAPKVYLTIGEPWEDMRRRSTAKIDAAITGHFGFRVPEADSQLHFVDSQYGFVTPSARFFAIFFDEDHVSSVRISPQIAPLPLDDTLKVVLDLQNQWRRAGWHPLNDNQRPSIADTPEWRANLRNTSFNGITYWQAGEKYQAMLAIARFSDDRHPAAERYLITIALAKPWLRDTDLE